MECKKCAVSVPAEYEYALTKNVCPKCGNKLLEDEAMKMYLDLKTKLASIEYVMDKNTVCERVAMFLITNYTVAPLVSTAAIKSSNSFSPKNTETLESKDVPHAQAKVEQFKAQLATINDDGDLTDDEIRAQEAFRAEELAAAREMGMDIEDDDMPRPATAANADRVERLKKLALSGNTGVRVKRAE